MVRFLPRKRLGLTLIEMIGVALLIGILAAVASFSVSGVRNANNTQLAKNRIDMVVNAARSYYVDHLKWPSSLSDLTAVGANGLPYLSEIPKDPFTEHQSSPQNLLYDPVTTRVWSRGRNGIDNQGSGDDIAKCANGSC